MLLLVPALWGWGYPLIRGSMDAIGPLGFLWLRFGIALVPIALVYGAGLRDADRRTWLHGLGIGLALFLAYAFLNEGLARTTTARAGFVIGLRVILVPLLAAGLFSLRAPSRVKVAAVLSVVGVAFMFATGAREAGGSLAGDGLVLASAGFFALHVVLVGRYATGRNYAPLLVLQLATVTALSLVGASLLETRLLPDDASVWPDVILAGLFATGLAFWIQNRVQFRVDSGHAGVIYATEPLFAALFGFLYLGEHLHGLQWIGGLVLLVAMGIARKP